MTSEIGWNAATPQDIEDLRAFVCTSKPPPVVMGNHRVRKLMGRPWERTVQSALRTLRWPLPADEFLLLGRDDEGIAGVSWWADLDGSAEVKILAVAIALRRQGDRLGDGLLSETKQRIIERADAAEVKELTVWAVTHARNHRAQWLLQRHGFHFISEYDNEQDWYHPPITFDH